ncbi:G-type lectin S-receptor-like serine/threonine-protein kinase At2g19130 [Dioscorea cayenensis subsp. rotundata]|uniref:G-type lectin S-receptor-like serine/threonine-protein kinase At2g19130 n=1 Tax=Dioscorea cayennensis subsp. rotundata TaxID=55577 RepID=A0AB40AZW0_DIOCR|nr:G-type lectin S-receptor-like serine/threonine-protein kinase At2g19130 [Dioscorea cayenensis subsp. rotundata]
MAAEMFRAVPCFSCSLLFLLVLFASLIVQHCSGGDTISWSQSLNGNQTIVSKEGHFELGFFSPGNSKNFYIGIWYKKVSPQTVIWVANREVPISNAASSELKITENGNLALLDHKKAIAWSSKSVLHQANSTEAVILDTGNLILRDSLNSSSIIWQSFDHPTDTWVPGGWLGMNKITGEYQSLTPWKNSEDPAPGPFIDTIDPSGLNQFLLMWNGTEVYWRSGVWNGYSFSETPGMNRDPDYITNFTDDHEKRVITQATSFKDVYIRNMMDTSGQNKQWLWTIETQAWMVVWSQPAACDVYSVCGAFGICDLNSKTLCSCPLGFKPVSAREWDLNDWNSGCTRKTNLPCSNDNSTVAETEGFLEMYITRLPPGSQPLTGLTAEECKQACLKSCYCTALLLWQRMLNMECGSPKH